MFRKYISVVLFLSGLTAASSSYAQYDFNSCLVKEIAAHGDLIAQVRLDCIIANVPACVVHTSYFGFDKSTQAGKDYFQMAMKALEVNAKVSGTVDPNNCSQQPDVPLLTHLRITR